MRTLSLFLLLFLSPMAIMAQPDDHTRHRGLEMSTRRPDNKYQNVMRTKDFNAFCKDIKKASFYNEQERLLLIALRSNDFTSRQCVELLQHISFSSNKVAFMKLIYPNIVDKELFFTAVRSLSFRSDQDALFGWIEKYHAKRR